MDEKTDIIQQTTTSGLILKYFGVNGLYFPSMVLNHEDHRDPETIIKNFKNIKARKDDVLVCGCHRSGTNWTWEIVSMLKNGSSEYQKDRKLSTILEFQYQQYFDELNSPRILSTHLSFEYIPKDFIDKKTKMVYIQRNPKDVAVSFFKYTFDQFGMEFPWEDYLDMFINAREDLYSSWIGTTKSWEKAIFNNPDSSILLVYYENLKKNTIEELTRIARFLEVRDDPDFIKDVAEKIGFSNMKEAKIKFLSESLQENPELEKIPENSIEKRSKYYRKGEVGDWKNYFTVAENEEFDKIMEKRMKDTKLKFVYSL